MNACAAGKVTTTEVVEKRSEMHPTHSVVVMQDGDDVTGTLKAASCEIKCTDHKGSW